MRKKKDAFKGCLAYRCWVYPWTEFSTVPAYNPWFHETDASGHGLCSALLMTSTRSYLRARAMQPGDLPQVVNDVNRLLYMDLQANKIQILGLI